MEHFYPKSILKHLFLLFLLTLLPTLAQGSCYDNTEVESKETVYFTKDGIAGNYPYDFTISASRSGDDYTLSVSSSHGVASFVQWFTPCDALGNIDFINTSLFSNRNITVVGNTITYTFTYPNDLTINTLKVNPKDLGYALTIENLEIDFSQCNSSTIYFIKPYDWEDGAPTISLSIGASSPIEEAMIDSKQTDCKGNKIWKHTFSLTSGYNQCGFKHSGNSIPSISISSEETNCYCGKWVTLADAQAAAKKVLFVNTGNWDTPKINIKNAGYTWNGQDMTYDSQDACGNKIYYSTFPPYYDNCQFTNSDNSQQSDEDLEIHHNQYYSIDNWYENLAACPKTCRTVYYVNTNHWTTPHAFAWGDGDAKNAPYPGVAMQNTGETDACGNEIWSYTYSVVDGFHSILFSNGTNNIGQSADMSLSSADGKYCHTSTWFNDKASMSGCTTIYYVNTTGYNPPYIYLWKDGGSTKNAAWPGLPMYDTGETDDCGNKVYAYSYMSNVFDRVKFSNNGATETGTLWIISDKYYSPAGNSGSGAWYNELGDCPATCNKVFFVNDATPKWSTPTAYVWKKSNNEHPHTWPGDAMTATGQKDNCGNDIYSYQYSKEYDGIIFSDNGTNQTANLDVHHAQYYYTNEFSSNNGWTDVPISYQCFDSEENLALNKPATASHNSGNAYLSNDDNVENRWEAGGGNHNAWWSVDLGGGNDIKYLLRKISIKWENARPKDYVIEASFDNTNWGIIYHGTTAPSGNAWTDYNLIAPARYLRVRSITDEMEAYGISIFEFRAYGSGIYTTSNPTWAFLQAEDITFCSFNLYATIFDKETTPEDITYHYTINGSEEQTGHTTNGYIAFSSLLPDEDYHVEIWGCDEAGNCTILRPVDVHTPAFDAHENLALRKPATASHSNTPATDGNDNVFTTSWESTNSLTPNNDWWQVDLQGTYMINQIKIAWDMPHPDIYCIKTSLDGTSWNTMYYSTKEATYFRPSNGSLMTYDVSGPARYLKVCSLKDHDTYRIGFWEFEAYGTGLYISDGSPVWTYCDTISVQASSFSVAVGAVDAETAPENMRYYYTINGNAPEKADVQDGQIRFAGLMPNTDYIVRIYAMDEDGNKTTTKELSVLTRPFKKNQNLALNKPSYAWNSPVTYRPDEGNDGLYGTSWAPGAGSTLPNQGWWYVDLGDDYNLTSIRVAFESEWVSSGFVLQFTSELPADPTDNDAWSTLAGANSISSSSYGSKQMEDNNTTFYFTQLTSYHARYVRIKMNDATDRRIREIEVYGSSYHDYHDMSYCEGTSVEKGSQSDVDEFVSGYNYHFNTENTKDVRVTFELLDNYSNVVCYLWDNSNGFHEYQMTPDPSNNKKFSYVLTGYQLGDDLHLGAKFAYSGGTRNMAVTKYFSYVVGTNCSEPLVDLFLSGSMNGNAASSADYQFKESKTPGVYYLKTHLAAGTYTYRLTDGTYNPPAANDGHWSEHDVQVVIPSEQDVYFYAKSVNHFACSFDKISITGALLDQEDPRVALSWDAEHTTATALVYFDERHTATSYNAYRLEKLSNTASPAVYDSVVSLHNREMKETWRAGVVSFNLSSLTCTWQEYNTSICRSEGGAGSGITTGAFHAFTDGYEIDMHVEGENLIIEAYTFDIGSTTGNAILWYFPGDDINVIREWVLDKDPSNDHHYFKTLSRAQVEIYSDAHWDWLGGTYRYAVKFEQNIGGPGSGISATDPFYFTLGGGQGCAPDTFKIYHHDDAPSISSVVSHSGGVIPQPICFRKRFTPGAWETLCLPFDVSRVTVFDESENAGAGAEVSLVPQHATGDGADYWLRRYGPLTEATETQFQGNWQNESSHTPDVPQKNVAYIMMVPDDDEHWYEGRYINFYGRSYQTIASIFTPPATPVTDVYKYVNNTTMMPQSLYNAYILRNDGEYFVNSPDCNTLYPFDCYVLSSEHNKQAAPMRQFAPRHHSDTPTGRPTIEAGEIMYRYQDGVLHVESSAETILTIYNVSGQIITRTAVAADGSVDIPLHHGFYVVESPIKTFKLIL